MNEEGPGEGSSSLEKILIISMAKGDFRAICRRFYFQIPCLDKKNLKPGNIRYAKPTVFRRAPVNYSLYATRRH